MRTTAIAVALSAVSLSACATVTRGTTEQLTFTSDPPAAVRTSTGLVCPTTPCTLEVSRKTEFIATFSQTGYENQDISVQTRVAGAGAAGFAGNVLVGGVIGMGVDAATGSTLEHYPNPVHASLVPLVLSKKPARKMQAPRGPVKPEVTPTS